MAASKSPDNAEMGDAPPAASITDAENGAKQEKPPNCGYEVSRIVIVVRYENVRSMQRVMWLVEQHNREVMGESFASIRDTMSAEGKTDILNVVCIIDMHPPLSNSLIKTVPRRMVIIEGKKENVAKVAHEIRGEDLIDVGPTEKMLFHPSLTETQCLYASFRHKMRVVKLRRPLDAVASSATQRAPVIQKVFDLFNLAPTSLLARDLQLFPTAAEIEELDMNYGTFVSDEEFQGACEPPPKPKRKV